MNEGYFYCIQFAITMKQETNEEILKKIFAFKKEGLKVLIGSLIIQMVYQKVLLQILGLLYAWPILYSYHGIMVQYRYLSTTSSILLYSIFPLMCLTMNICMSQFLSKGLPRGDSFMTKYGPKQMILIFSSIICMALTLIGFFKDMILLHFSLWVFVIGPSIGFLYMIPFQLTWKYFIKQKAHLNSLFQLFLGIGACLFIQIFEMKAGPTTITLYYDEAEPFQAICHQIEIREAYRQSAILIFMLGFISSLLVTQPDGIFEEVEQINIEKTLETMLDYDLLAYSHQDIFNSPDVSMEIIDKDVPTFETAIKGRPFGTMVLVAFSMTFLSYLFLGQFPQLNKQIGVPYSYSVTAFKVSIIFYGSFRFFIQYCSERYSYDTILKILLNLNIGLITLLIMGMGFKNPIICCLSTCGIVVTLNGTFSTISINIPKIFGPNIAQKMFNLILMVLSMTNIISQTLSYATSENAKLMVFVTCPFVVILQLYLCIRIRLHN